MDIPSAMDFLEAFGIEPTEEDPGTAFFRYVVRSQDGLHEMDISFSGVSDSFQVALRCGGKEAMVVSSEKVQTIELRQDQSESGVHVRFDIGGVMSEALVTLAPSLHCRWWTLRAV